MLKKGLHMLLGASLFGMGMLFVQFDDIVAQVRYGDLNNAVFDCMELHARDTVYAGSIQCKNIRIYDPSKGKAGGYINISYNGIQVYPSSDNPNGITIRIPDEPSLKGAVTHIDAGGVFVGKIDTEEEVWKQYFRGKLIETKYPIGSLDPDAFAALYIDTDDLKPRVLVRDSDSVTALSAKDNVVHHQDTIKKVEDRLPKKIFDERSKIEPKKPIQDTSDLDRIYKPKKEEDKK